MAKYIDQSAAIARLTHLEVTKPTATMTDAKRALADMFPADVALVAHVGRWQYVTRYNDGERMIASCSRCGVRGEVRTIRTALGLWEIDSPCCPSCGAKMDL